MVFNIFLLLILWERLFSYKHSQQDTDLYLVSLNLLSHFHLQNKKVFISHSLTTVPDPPPTHPTDLFLSHLFFIILTGNPRAVKSWKICFTFQNKMEVGINSHLWVFCPRWFTRLWMTVRLLPSYCYVLLSAPKMLHLRKTVPFSHLSTD